MRGRRARRWFGSTIAIGVLLTACGSSNATSGSVPSLGSSSTSTSTTTVDPSRLGGAVWWSDGRTGTADDLDAAGLVVSFVGSPASHAQDPYCGTDYVGVAEETPTEVIVTVHQVRDPGASIGTVCQAIGATRAVSVALTAPVGDRIVRDGADGRTHELLAGPSLVSVSDLPEGFTWWSEGGTFLVDEVDPRGRVTTGWSRVWSATAEGAAACWAPARTISVARFDWPSPALPVLPPGWVEVPSGLDGRGTIRNSSFDADHGSSMTRIDLLRDGSLIRLEGSAACSERPPGFEDLERVAASIS